MNFYELYRDSVRIVDEAHPSIIAVRPLHHCNRKVWGDQHKTKAKASRTSQSSSSRVGPAAPIVDVASRGGEGSSASGAVGQPVADFGPLVAIEDAPEQDEGGGDEPEDGIQSDQEDDDTSDDEGADPYILESIAGSDDEGVAPCACASNTRVRTYYDMFLLAVRSLAQRTRFVCVRFFFLKLNPLQHSQKHQLIGTGLSVEAESNLLFIFESLRFSGR
jgi:hypothetical protein